jgi:hypothetical protein
MPWLMLKHQRADIVHVPKVRMTHRLSYPPRLGFPPAQNRTHHVGRKQDGAFFHHAPPFIAGIQQPSSSS